MLGIQAVVIVLQIIKYVMFGVYLTPSITPFYQESYGLTTLNLQYFITL